MQFAPCNCLGRGVVTTIIFPYRERFAVRGAASRSYYSDLLARGEHFRVRGGLLHSKSLTLDGEVTLIGSANMDRRSFELNYENNTLVYDPVLTAEIRRRQDDYLARSRPVLGADVSDWTLPRQFWNNVAAMLSPGAVIAGGRFCNRSAPVRRSLCRVRRRWRDRDRGP